MERNAKLTPGEALEKLMRICSGREMCSSDLTDRMEKWGIKKDEQEKILKKLAESRFYCNTRYTKAFIHDKCRLGNWGRKKIKYALKGKNIPEELINDLLEDTDSVEYAENLADLLKKKRRSIKTSEPPQRIKARLYRFAAGRGYEPELIIRVLNKLIGD